MNGPKESELIIKLNLNAWLIMVALSLSSLLFFPLEITAGVMVGGLLVSINLHLLRRVIVRALAPGSRVSPGSVLIKYYLCFLATGVIIFILISQGLIDGLGLLLGLSTFIINIFMFLFHQTGIIIYKLIIKEAV